MIFTIFIVIFLSFNYTIPLHKQPPSKVSPNYLFLLVVHFSRSLYARKIFEMGCLLG
ncbi:hypothetical protein SAMN05720758_2312 [Fibrobacter sp. UWB11]|nr:hypothetical protein SAMN05720758_2312 [Fibrobacter sp. UWB11]